MDHLYSWVPMGMFILAGSGILVKGSALLTRMETLLSTLIERVEALEDDVFARPKPRARRK